MKRGHIIPEELWWTDRMDLASVIDWANEVGEIQTVAQAVHVIEKPHLYTDLWTAWRASV